jgi:hypothetical protein
MKDEREFRSKARLSIFPVNCGMDTRLGEGQWMIEVGTVSCEYSENLGMCSSPCLGTSGKRSKEQGLSILFWAFQIQMVVTRSSRKCPKFSYGKRSYRL